MATTRKIEKKNGQIGYQIIVKKDGKQISMTWNIPDGMTDENRIQATLAKEVKAFERKVLKGELRQPKQVKEEKAKELAEDRKRQAAEAKIVTFRQFTDDVFMADIKRDCKEHTRDSYERMIKCHIYPVIGDEKITDITPQKIHSLLANLQPVHQPLTKDKPTTKYKSAKSDEKTELSHATVIKIYNILNGIMKKAFKLRVIPNDIMSFVDRPRERQTTLNKTDEQKTNKAFTQDEVLSIKAGLASEPLKWQTLINTLIFTGCRRGEVLGIRWTDVNPDGTIEIKNNICYTPNKGVYVDSPKSKSSKRTVFVPKEVLELFKQMKAERRKDLFKLGGVKLNQEDFVFVQEDLQTPMLPDSVTRYCKYFEDAYGIKDFNPHRLRHSFASIAITNGADIVSVSELLGHSNVSTTLNMYSHSNDEAKRKANGIFQNALLMAENS